MNPFTLEGVSSGSKSTCTSCKAAKEAEAFSPDKRKKNGLASRCKDCKALDARLAYFASKTPQRGSQPRGVLTDEERAELAAKVATHFRTSAARRRRAPWVPMTQFRKVNFK